MKKYFFQKIKIGLPFFAICAIIMSTGVWRSLVARSAGRPLNRVGAAFGSYGWSGESPKIIQEWLASMNMDMPADPVKCLFVPKHEGLSQCVALGKTVAEALKAKC